MFTNELVPGRVRAALVGRGAPANDLPTAYCCDFCCFFASFLFLWCWYSAPPAAPSAAPFLPPTMAPPVPPTTAPFSLLCFFAGACCAAEPCASAFSSASAVLVAVVSRKAAPSSAEPILFVREIPAMMHLPERDPETVLIVGASRMPARTTSGLPIDSPGLGGG